MEQVLKLVKNQLGITINSRDEYITAIIKGTLQELKEVQGLQLELDNNNELLFLVDLVAWRYDSKGEDKAIPERLYWRLRNLMVSKNANI
jgi:hypothetical protein